MCCKTGLRKWIGRGGLAVAVGITFLGGVQAQAPAGRPYTLEAPPLVPIPQSAFSSDSSSPSLTAPSGTTPVSTTVPITTTSQVVVQPAPVVVQRPTLIPRPTPTVVQYAPVQPATVQYAPAPATTSYYAPSYTPAIPAPTVVQYAPSYTPSYVGSTGHTVVQYAPATTYGSTVVQPTVVQPTVVQYGPTTSSAPVVVQRLSTTPIVAAPAASHTVWYSAPADVAPTLATAPTNIGYTQAVQPAVATMPVATMPVATVPVASVPVTATPIVVGTAPSYVYRPVVTPTAVLPSYYMGNGLLGQPKLYVSGQPVRNALRYLSP
jgi:hypothetical protein